MNKYAMWPDGTYCDMEEVEEYSHMSDDYQVIDETEFVEILIAPRTQSIRVGLDIRIDQLTYMYDELESYIEVTVHKRKSILAAKKCMKEALEILYEV